MHWTLLGGNLAGTAVGWWCLVHTTCCLSLDNEPPASALSLIYQLTGQDAASPPPLTEAWLFPSLRAFLLIVPLQQKVDGGGGT